MNTDVGPECDMTPPDGSIKFTYDTVWSVVTSHIVWFGLCRGAGREYYASRHPMCTQLL